MTITLKSSQILMFRNYLSSLQKAEFALVELKRSTGMTVIADDLIVKACLNLNVPFDDEGEFAIKTDMFLKIMNCAENEVVLSINSGTIRATVDGTDLLLQSPFMEFEPFPAPDMNTFSVPITSDRIQEIVSNLAVQKLAKSQPIAVMEFGDRTKYGVNSHMVSYATPEFAGLNGLFVSYEFFKYLSFIPKYKTADWKFFKDNTWFGFSCGYVTYFTSISKSFPFPDLSTVLAQNRRSSIVLTSLDDTAAVSKIITKLFIPIFEDPDPVLYLRLHKNKVEYHVIDKANNVSRSEMLLPVEIRTADPDVIAKVHFLGFASVLDKKALAYPVQIHVLTSALLFEYGDVQEFVQLYS